VKGFSIGSLVAAMLPYSLAFAAGGLALLLAWLWLGLPVGPGAPAFMAPYGAAAAAAATP
jgi:aminobenzoyl-glutamate transport protein